METQRPLLPCPILLYLTELEGGFCSVAVQAWQRRRRHHYFSYVGSAQVGFPDQLFEQAGDTPGDSTVINITSTAASSVNIELHMAFSWSLAYSTSIRSIPKAVLRIPQSASALKRGQGPVRQTSVQLPPPPTVLTGDVDVVGKWAYFTSQSETGGDTRPS